MKHTKGNWQVKQSGEYKNIFVLGHIANPNGHTSICNTAVTSLSKEETEANAKLIAAAPDLLKSLQAFVEWANINDESASAYLKHEAMAAINKAIL